MTTRETAALILGHLYNLTVEQGAHKVSEETLSRATDLSIEKINLALRYLNTKKLIDSVQVLSGKFMAISLTNTGIQTVDDKAQFKRNIGLTVGIPGIISGHWNASEK